MLPTCIGISGVSRYRNDASIEDSFLASLIFPSRERITRRLGGASGVQTGSISESLIRIVHSPEPHMQWQTGPIDQIAGIRPRPGPNGPQPPTTQPRSHPARHG